MTNLSTQVNERLEQSKLTPSAVLSFNEYVKSRLADVQSFLEANEGYMAVPVAEEITDEDTQTTAEVNRTVAVSAQQYQSCLNGAVDQVTLPINDVGDTIVLSSSDLLNAVEDQIAELQCQSIFFDYTLGQVETSTSEFITRVRAIMPDLKSELISKYSSFIQTGGSSFDALSNFFATISDEPEGDEGSYLALTDINAYTGNAWVSAMTYVALSLANFFHGVFEALGSIEKLFSVIKTKCLSALRWLGGLFFGNLLTDYEKASNAPLGVMDLPFWQVNLSSPLGGHNPNNWWIWNQLRQYKEVDVLYALDGSAHVMHTDVNPEANVTVIDFIHHWIDEGLRGATQRLAADGTYVPCITEVTIPSQPFNMAARLGRAQKDGDIYLQLFFVSDYATWSKYSDQTLETMMMQSFVNAMLHVSSVVPMSPDPESNHGGYVDLGTQMWNWVESSGSWPERLKMVGTSMSDLYSNYDSAPLALTSVLCTCLYVMLFSHGVPQLASNPGIDMNAAIWTQWITYDAGYDAAGDLEELTGYGEAFNASIMSLDTYKPYSSSSIMPATIHYQTTDEQAQELVKAVVKVLIVAAVAYITIKTIKWKKQRKKTTLLAKANLDRLSWDVSSNPTDANISAFNKAYSKMKRIDFVNSLLGISASTATGGWISGAFDALSSSTVSSSRTAQNDYQSTAELIRRVRLVLKNQALDGNNAL